MVSVSHSSPPKPNVMILIGNLLINSGGAQRAIANQLQHASEGCNYFVCHFFGQATLAEQFPDHVTVCSLNAKHALDLRIFLSLRNLIKTHNIDIIHTQSNIAGIWGRAVAVTTGAKLKVISTEQNTHQRYRNLTGLVNGITLLGADRIVSVSDATRDSFFGWENWLLKNANFETVHNAVDTEKFAGLTRDGCPPLRSELGLAEGDLLLGNVARMDTQKNQKHMIEEFSQIAAEVPMAKLLIIGRGHLRRSLQRTIDHHGLQSQVKIIGARADMENVYRMLDVFLLPSLYEGFSLALLEAMAAGLPVVCSNIPQILEATADTALAVDPQKKGALAEAMLLLIKDSQRRSDLAQQSKQRASSMFDASKLARRYEEIYHELASATG